MTRRSDLMCEDLFECDHAPETAVVDDGQIVAWICRCGSKQHVVGICGCEHSRPQGPESPKMESEGT